jgi:hypothetical protein
LRTFRLALILVLLFSLAQGQGPSAQPRQENPNIARLAAVTRADHSTIFFTSPDGCGYARNGEVYRLEFKNAKSSSLHECPKLAVSHDGRRIAYAAAADPVGHGRVLLRDLDSGSERDLITAVGVPTLLCWSWEDTEILYLEGDAIAAFSVAESRKRILARLPIQIEGAAPIHPYHLKAVAPLHHGAKLVLSVQPWYPTGRRDEYTSRDQVLLWSPDAVRVLVTGAAAALAPAKDQIAYIGDKIEVIDADGSNRRTITRMPFGDDSPWGGMVWSPKGDRLWLTTIVDEGGNTNGYVVDARSEQKKRILKKTLIRVTDWRP